MNSSTWGEATQTLKPFLPSNLQASINEPSNNQFGSPSPHGQGLAITFVATEEDQEVRGEMGSGLVMFIHG